MTGEVMNEIYREYYVITKDVDELKRQLGSLAATHAVMQLEIVGAHQEQGPSAHVIDFRVGEITGVGGFIGRGTIEPHHTEASIRSQSTESGSEYLVMIADLDSGEPVD